MGTYLDLAEVCELAQEIAGLYSAMIDVVSMFQTKNYNHEYQNEWAIKLRIRLGSTLELKPEVALHSRDEWESLKLSLAH